jgi:hypothetical protein
MALANGAGPNPGWQSPSHWAALTGGWSFPPDSPDSAGYEGPVQEPRPSGMALFGLALTDLRLRDGTAKVTIEFEDPMDSSAGIVLGFRSESASYLLPQLGGYGAAYAIADFHPGEGWKAVAMAGARQHLDAKHPYDLEIRQAGQKLLFSVDGIQIFEHFLPSPLEGTQVGVFGWGEKGIAFRQFRVRSERPRAFVAMQFGEPFDTIYKEVIRPEGEKLGLEVLRADEIPGPGIIFRDMQDRIAESNVVIAEISAPNQNVFYELGYAHALNTPTILLAQRGREDELPFDIRSYRVIFYDNSIGGKVDVERNLTKHLRSVLQEF